MPKTTQETPEYAYAEERGLFTSIKLIFSSVSDAVVGLTGAVGKTTSMLSELAEAGEVMAKSNTRLVTLNTRGVEAMKTKQLRGRFPDLDLDLDS